MSSPGRKPKAAPKDPAPIGLGNREDIARLAYTYWEARGCPLGSADEDWFRAEREVEQRHTGTLIE